MHPLATTLLVAAVFSGSTPGQQRSGAGSRSPQRLDTNYRPPSFWVDAVRRATADGQMQQPTVVASRRPPVAPRQRVGACLTHNDLFVVEDTQRVFMGSSFGATASLMAQSTNAVIAAHGDEFDFVGFWLNFQPRVSFGAAYYLPIENDVLGIGDPSQSGTPVFNQRPALGINGQRVQGFVMMHDVNDGQWQAGTAPGAEFTRLALAQEFGHRWVCFLPPLSQGRPLQGNNRNCGRQAHWNWRVDAQGSGTEISEWVGVNPANLVGSFVNFNTDTGGVFSYPDLYLMGYVSGAEMDASSSELRYMDGSSCAARHNGAITAFGSSDIIAVSGPRVPDWTASRKHFRTAWIMIHLPGAMPTTQELDKAVAILEQHMVDWSQSTVGRGSMDNSLDGGCGAASTHSTACRWSAGRRR